MRGGQARLRQSDSDPANESDDPSTAAPIHQAANHQIRLAEDRIGDRYARTILLQTADGMVKDSTL